MDKTGIPAIIKFGLILHMLAAYVEVGQIVLLTGIRVKFLDIFLESIFGMFISISMQINTKSALKFFKSKSVDMLIYFTHNTSYI